MTPCLSARSVRFLRRSTTLTKANLSRSMLQRADHGALRCIVWAQWPFLYGVLTSKTKIYVGNLPFSTSESEIRGLFSQHGTVESVSVITDRDTGQPRGFAFVEMSRADASRAIQNLNGKALGGRPLRVNETQERQNAARGPKRW